MSQSHKKKVYTALKKFFLSRHPENNQISVEENHHDEQWSRRDTLVGVLRNVAQLNISLTNRFYHIPAKYLSEFDLPLKYVAMYQSKNLFGNDAGIYYYGEVESVACVKRKQITEIPKNSEEYYYRFNIKQWKTLNNPIEAKEIGFIRILTNFEMLNSSTEIPQLLLKNKSMHDMYTHIRNSILAVQENPTMEPPILQFENHRIVVELDDILLFKGTKLINSFSVYDFLDLPNSIMIQIYKNMKN